MDVRGGCLNLGEHYRHGPSANASYLWRADLVIEALSHRGMVAAEGRKLRKLTAPEGVEGYLLPLAKRLTNTGYRYEISPMREFDLALFFGLTGSDERLDPSPVNGSTPNPPPPDPAPAAGSQSGVNSVNSFSPPLHAERNGVSSKKGEKPKRKNPSNPPHPSLSGLSTAPIGSAHDVESDDNHPHWGPEIT